MPPLPGAPEGAPEDRGLTPKQLADKYALAVSGRRPGLVTYVKQLWRRRQFIVSFATAKLTAQYTTAKMGQLWQVLTPLLNILVYYFVFGVLLGTKRNIPDFIQYLSIGVFIFTFTQQAVLQGTRSISSNLGLIRALHFPRACMPISTTVQQLQQLLFSLVVMIAIVLVVQPPTLTWLLLIPALVLQFVFNTGLSLIVARLGAKVTDMAQLVPFILRTWMYTSGVMWSLTVVSHGKPEWVKILLAVNPAAVYIDLARYSLLDSFHANQLPHHVWLLAVAWAVVVGIGGFIYFWRAEEEYGRG
ncbi:ABC transporter permease [Mangrovactinospora gilvigrisea]|nr:ABC transporter permease [Mangrovactinospora gilvigrisea]